MPFAALHDPRLRASDTNTLLALDAVSKGGGWVQISTEALADASRATRTFTQDSLKRLEAAGWVERRRRKDPNTGADLRSEIRVRWDNEVEERGANDVATPLNPDDLETPLPVGYPDQEALDAAAATNPRLPMDKVAADFRRYHERKNSLRRSWPDTWMAWVKRAEKDYPHEPGHHPVRSPRSPRDGTGSARVAEAAARYAVQRAHRDDDAGGSR